MATGRRKTRSRSQGGRTRTRNRRTGSGSAPGKRSVQAAPRRRRWAWPFLKWTLTLGVWGVILLLGVAAWHAWHLPDLDRAIEATRRPSITLLARDGERLAEYGDLYGEPVSVQDLPPYLPQALLATEDRRFREHFGVDPRGIARAAWVNLKAGRIVQGGSTLTQQLAKNLFLTPERSLSRKIRELLLALWLEAEFTKDQLLTLYLNRVYLGAGTYGVEAAARTYFDKPVRAVTMREAAILAGLPRAPSRDNPRADPERARARAAEVLENMVEAGYLTPQQARRARRGEQVTPRARRQGRHFADWVLDGVADYVGRPGRDLVVHTTLDRDLQATAEATLRRHLHEHGREKGASEGAVVVMDPDGAVRALVGGRSHAISQFNRATQARRQPGSAFKPFLWLAALEQGLAPDSVVRDAPVSVDGWTPHNYADNYRGPVSLATALAESLNTVAARLVDRVGPETLAATARRLGIDSPLTAEPSLALGTSEVTPLELTVAYAPFANGGLGVWPHAIRRITDGGGTPLYQRRGGGPGRVVPPRRIGAMNRMLRTVVTEGTGRRAALAGHPAGGKTGTTDGYRDAWFVGFTAHRVAGVWIGNDKGASMDGVTGGGLPARVWHDVMTAAHRGLPTTSLPGTDRPAPRPRGEARKGWVDRIIGAW